MRLSLLLRAGACAAVTIGAAACAGSGATPAAAPSAAAATPESQSGVAALVGVEARDGFPDPRSALAHVSELAIFDDQGAPLRALASRLEAQLAEVARARSEALRAFDAELDKADADRDPAKLRALVAEVGRLDTEAATVTLDARLETRRILRPEQLVKLRALRSATGL